MNADLIESFVNTFEVRTERDDLDSPAALVSWLQAHGLLEPGASAGARDLAEARACREALRDVLAGQSGIEVDVEAAGAVLDRVAERARLELRFPGGEARIEPRAGGVRGALGRLLTEVAAGQRDGDWARMKACRADDCRWAFLDETKNRSRAWCDMGSCGNRAKARRFRERHQHAGEA